MSEQDLDEIVQITVEDFNQDDRTGKIPVKQHEYFSYCIVTFSALLTSIDI